MITATEAGIYSGIAGSLLTLIFTKGMDAWVAYRRQAFSECSYEDEQVVKGYQYVIGELKSQNDKLEDERKREIAELKSEIARVSNEHIDCIRVSEGLKVHSLRQQQELEALRKELNELRSRVAA